MQLNGKKTRQAMGCGYEPQDPSITAEPWSHGGKVKLTVCPGYTTQLPAVVEIRRLHKHWDKGELSTVLRGQELHEDTEGCIEVFDEAKNEAQASLIRDAGKGGGGES